MKIGFVCSGLRSFGRLFLVLCGLITVMLPSVARAQTAQRIYELNGSYAETNGGSALVPAGGTLGATGYTFAAGQGPSVSNALANTGEYTIEMVFRMNSVGSYLNLINFNNRTNDNAIYCLSGKAYLYSYSGGLSATTDFVAGQTHRLVVTRNASTKVTTAYVDGVQKAQVTDSGDYYVASAANGILHFFHDDGGEDAAGFIDQIRIYHSVLTSTQVAALGQTTSTAPEIQLKGNGTVILDGDTTPSTADHTDFGAVTTSFARTFTIENTGTAALTISSIAVSGTHASQFVVSGAPSSVAAGASATFTVTFTPGSGSGARTATITVNNNDADEAAYDFAVTGTATASSGVTATYATGTEVPVTSNGYTATGTAGFTLGYAPATGTQLMVVKNTGLGFISGRFSNLAQGQLVTLSYGGKDYRFVANYYGGTGNDLVLLWADQKAYGWGENGQGQTGNADTTSRLVAVPAIATGALAGKTLVAVSSGGLHSVGLCSDGTVVAWGYNQYGQLGNGTTVGGPTPVAVSATGALAGKTVVAVVAGYLHSMVLCSDGTVVTWGYNGFGQLGTGNTTDSFAPVAVTTSTGALAGKTVVSITSGVYHSIAVCADGTVASWGYNSGNSGNGGLNNSSVPVAPNTAGALAGKTVIAASASFSHTLFLCSDGTVVGTGSNSDGQLGNGSTTFSTSPVLIDTSGVLAGKTVAAVTAGDSHSVALCSDGTLVAWGKNTDGQLGNNTITNSNVPVLVTATGALAGKTPVAIDAGSSHSHALCSDGTVVSWGSNGYGQLGTNNTTRSLTPVALSTGHLSSGARFVATSAASSGNLGILALPLALPPAVTAISPNLVHIFGGRTVTITGTGFTDATAVTFGGTAATSFTVLDDTSIQAVVPAGSIGPASVLVTTPAGTNAANSLLTYRGTPLMTSVTPDRGTTNGGTTVTLLGENFYEVQRVTFGGVAGTLVSVTPTAITVVTPPRATAGSVFLSLETLNGTHTRFFTYIVPPPGEVDPLNASIVGSIVLSNAVQPDGRTLIAGNFSQVLGANRNHLVRLLADGSLDTAFNPNPNGPVTSVAVQPDGKILLGGQFTALQPNGAASPTARNRIARLNTDGSLDTTFDPNANATVQVVVPQPDGRILVGGAFNTLQPNGAASPTTRNRVARLLADGSLDAAFDPSANDEVLSLATQGDGRVLVAGRFTTLQPNGAASPASRNRIARLNTDGTLDATFDPNADGVVNAVAAQADGRILLGGAFGTLQPNGAASATARTNLARVLANGSLDTSFDPRPNGAVNTLALQADGRVLLGGAFTTLAPGGAAATTRNRVARLNADGTLDTGFDPSANNIVFSIALRADGAVLLGGFFTALQPNGATTPIARDYFVRLANDAATQSVSAVDSSWAYWSRGGSAPELAAVWFEISTDSGATWTALPGTAARVGASADWELTRTDLPTSGLLRARGRTAGGFQGGGAGLVEFQATYTAPLAPPAVTAVSPALGATLGGETVTITGNRFGSASAVTFGGNPATSFNVVNASTITAVTPAGAAGATSVRVTTPVGTSGGNSLFTYVTPPTITAITPALGSTHGGDSVVITGTNFTNASAVSLGGTPVASFVVNSNTQITAVTPAGTAGAARVTVTVPGATSAPNTLYTYISPPTLTSLSPATGSTVGGQSVTLIGTNLSLASSVTFGGVSAAFTVNSATQITVTAPALPAGQVGVVVTTPGGSTTAGTLFTAVAPPGVTSVAPAFGSTLGGNTLTITGTGFSGATAVTVGGNAATGLTVVNGTTLTATTPAGVAGTASVVVVGPYGASAANSLFTYVAPPTLTSVSPAAGSTTGGQTVTLTGTNFALTTGVTFGGVAAASFTINSDTQITAVTPATSAGAKSVIVTTPGGSNAANSLYTTSVPTTTTTLTSAQNPSVFLTPPTFTAQAVSAQAGLTGQMSFFVDDVLVETKTVNASGAATFTPGTAIFGAGSRVVRAVFDGGAFFAASSATVTQVVNKSPVVITLGALSPTYDGTAKSATATTDVPSGYTVSVTFTYDGSSGAPINAGTYAVAATINHANFQGTKTGQLVIAKAPLTFTVASTPLIYNGTPRVPSLTFSPTGVPTTVTYQSVVGGAPTGPASSVAPTQAGRYQGNVSSSDPNYILPVATFQFDVVKANAALTFTNTEQAYDGTPRAPIIYSDPLGIPLTLTYQPLVNGVPTGSVSSQAPVAVGQYQVAATSPNHQLTPAAAVLRVGKRPVTISITGLSVSFDGQPKPVTVTTQPSGIPVTVTYTANGATTATAPSAPPAGGLTWRVDAVPTDTATYSGSATGLLRIETRRQPTLALTGPALSTPSSSGSFVATLGNTSSPKPTGSVYYRTLDGYGLFSGTVGADGKAVMTRSDFYLPTRAAPYQMVAEYSGDANYLPAVSNVHVNRIEKDVKVFAEYSGFLEYTGRPAVIPTGGLAFLYYNPNLVKSYQITYNGSTTLPANPTTSPARIEVRYSTIFTSTDYLDVINLNILPSYARVKVSNLRQAYSSGGNPVQVTTDPAGLATRVTYNGAVLPNGPTTPGTYQVAATLVDTNFRLYNVAEASGTLVITQDSARFTVTNLTQNYDGTPKSVSVTSSPSIPYIVLYDGSTRAPTAPGTYGVRVYPENALYGTGSNHTLVIRARVSATVNGQTDGSRLRLKDASGNMFTSFPAYVNPNQNEWTLEFVGSDDLKFVKWSDGSKDNPRKISLGGAGDPASYTFNAEAGQRHFLKAQTVSTGLPSGAGGAGLGEGYYAAGQLARFEAGTYGDAIINRWEYNGKVLDPADGHIILRDGREVYIKVRAGGGNPVCHITAGYIAEGFANGGNGSPSGTVDIKRLDYPNLPVLSQRFMPNGVNYIATAKPTSGFIFQGWLSSSSSQFTDTLKNLGYAVPGITEEFRRVGTGRYSSVFPNFIKDGPEFAITVSNQKRKASAAANGVDIAGIRTADVRITNNGRGATGVNLKKMKVTAFRVKRPNTTTWQYYYLNATGGEVDDNNRSNLTSGERNLLFINQPVAINGEVLNIFNPLAALDSLVADNGNPVTLDYPLGSIGYNSSQTVSILLGGSGQDVNFGLRAEIEVRMLFTVETNQGTQEVKAWWTDLNPM